MERRTGRRPGAAVVRVEGACRQDRKGYGGSGQGLSTKDTAQHKGPAVNARPCGSCGISFTSMVPTALGIGMVRRIVLFSKSHTRIEPRRTGSPGITFKVLAGRMKSEVTIRFSSGRAEIPCGL